MASSRTSAGVGLGVGIFLLALGTAGIHLYMGLSFGNTLFVLNGLGYLGLLAALQLPVPQLVRFRGAARWALMGYAALTIVLYFIDNPGMTIGYVDKAIEVALIALLLAPVPTERAPSPPERRPGYAQRDHESESLLQVPHERRLFARCKPGSPTNVSRSAPGVWRRGAVLSTIRGAKGSFGVTSTD